MNKQSTRAFAAGIFLSAITLIVFSYYNNEDADPETALENKGFVIFTAQEAKQQKEELSSLHKQIEELTQQNNVPEAKENEADEESASEEILLTVSPGMTSKEITDQLESAGIIKNASDLNSYLLKSGLADKIQIGEYRLTSDMTLEEISQLLTK